MSRSSIVDVKAEILQSSTADRLNRFPDGTRNLYSQNNHQSLSLVDTGEPHIDILID